MSVWTVDDGIERAPLTGVTAGPNFVACALASLSAGLLCAYVGSLLQMNAESLARLDFSGLFVSDAMSLENSVRLAWRLDWHNWPNLMTFVGAAFLYFPIVVFGAAAAATINILLLLAAALFFLASVNRIFGEDRSRSIFYVALLCVFGNLYIIEVINFPNKEIPLIFLTNAVVYFAICRGNFVIPLLATVISYFFRDGFLFILALMLMLAIFRLYINRPAAVVALVGMTVLFSILPIADIASFSAALDRNAGIGQNLIGERFSALGDTLSYIARIAGNTANLGLRPQFADETGGFYVLALGYWQFGVVLLSGVLWALKTAWAPDARKGALAMLLLVALLGVSYSSYVQPRYMMPLIFWLSLGLSLDIRTRVIAIASCVLAPIAFAALNVLPPLAVSGM